MRSHAVAVAILAFPLPGQVRSEDWDSPAPYRVVLQVKPEAGASAHRVLAVPLDFAALRAGISGDFNPYSLLVAAMDGATPGQAVPFRFDPKFRADADTNSFAASGDLVFAISDPQTTRFAVYFGPEGESPGKATPWPLIGDGDLLRLAGDGHSSLRAPAAYPCLADLDGDGRRDLIGSSRYGTGARVVWFRNVGTDTAPAFSDHEVYPLQTVDGHDISNPNHGWLLTATFYDWDGDGRRDLLVGGWCRYLTYYKNIGTDTRPRFAPGKVIFDAKVLPGLDYGPSPETIYQGVFVEPCDWDGDGQPDLLCGTYMRGHMYFLRNTGRSADGLPILAEPVALEADGKPIDFLVHGKPSVGDWNGDGKPDLMSGQYYTESSPARDGSAGSYVFENIGDRSHPKLAKGVQLRDTNGHLISQGFHSQSMMLDWNKDGKMDVLVTGMTGSQLYLNTGTAAEPKLVATPIPFTSFAPCAVSNFAYPLAFDLDRDGILDLIVGDGDGYVHFFKGLAGRQYAPPIRIKSAGKEIHEVGCPDGGEAHCGYAKAVLADWNGDGRPDLILWSNNGLQGWQRGSLGPDQWCLKFFPGTADPLDFGAAVEITAAGQHIPAGYRCKPEVADLDGDGLLDLIVACGHGKVNDECTMMFFKNIGTKTEWKLAAPVALMKSDGQPLTVPVRTAARLVDWDGDGDLDLITGNHSPYGVRYWQNVGTKSKPLFAPAQPMKRVNELVNSHHEVGIDAVDLDGDGSLDLVVGNGDTGTIHFFRRAFLDAQPAVKVVAEESKAERGPEKNQNR